MKGSKKKCLTGITLGSLTLMLTVGCTTLKTTAPQNIAEESALNTSPVNATEPTTSPSAPSSEPTYQTYTLLNGQVHVVTLPAKSDRHLAVAISDELAPLAEIASKAGAIAAINAGFFDPQNGLTTSYITIQNRLVADPQENPRLMENPDLAPYLEAILDRSEFRIYDCEGTVQYAIVRHSEPAPPACTLTGAVGAGPQLLPANTGYAEGFLADNPQGERIRDALGSQSLNARSAVGLKADGTVILAMASQQPDLATPTGITLDELANFLRDLGVTSALNLDGGSSAGLLYQGEIVYGHLDASNNPIERPIKSVLLIR